MTLRELWTRARAVGDSLSERRTFGVAAEMSFWLFCALVPLVFSTITLAAMLAPGGDLASLFRIVPPEARQLVARELSVVLERHTTPSVTAVLLAFWLASSGVHAIFDGFEVQLGVTSKWRTKRLKALAGVAGLSIGALVVALVWREIVKHAGETIGLTIAAIVASAAVLYAIVAGLYWLGTPPGAARELPRAPGTLAVVALFGVASVGYRAYLVTFGNGSALLAGTAVVVVTLTALYLFSIALLLGLAINQRVAEWHAHRRTASKLHDRGAFAPPMAQFGVDRVGTADASTHGVNASQGDQHDERDRERSREDG
jgi:membrane protein